MRDRNPGIYFIINLENGKIYVGQTVSMKTRLSGHLTLLRRGSHSNRHLQGSFDQYGERSFYFYIAEFCSVESLTDREQFWIDFFGNSRLYNIAPAGGSCLGITHTEETRLKVSLANKGRKQAKHVIDAVRLSNSTRPLKPETRAKLSAALRRRVISDETRKKLSAANKGRPLSDAQKKKLSEARSKKLTAFGETLTISQWSNKTGVPATAISKRLSYGWSVEDSVSKPKQGKSVEAYGANLGVMFHAAPDRRAA